MSACLADHAGMPTATVRPCAILEIRDAAGAEALLAEYEAESSIKGLGGVCPQWDTYAALEDAGLARAWVAEVDGQIVGLLVLMSAVLPHYGRKIATTESFFVAAAHRSSGAGLALLREAKRAAADMWCAGIFASAPAGGRADELFSVMGLEPVSRIYFAAVE